MTQKSTYENHMWTEVVFDGANSDQGIAMAYALRSDGLVLDKDFTWTYIPKDSVVGMDRNKWMLSEKSVIIGFRDPTLATFYTLKWQR